MSKDWGKALNGIANVVEQEEWPCSAQFIREVADEIKRLQSLLEAANEMEADREAALQEIDRLQEHNLKLMDANVRLSDKVIHLKKECEDKDRVIRAGVNTAKRLRAALERIERHCDADSSRIVHEIQVMAREALRDD